MRIATKVNNRPLILFGILFILVLLNQLITLKIFGFQYTGSDDVTFWQMANDYSKGIFHEPFFYGQNYNFGLESFFSIPLIWCGIPVYYALPIVSTLLGIFPFLLFAIVLFRRGYITNSLVFLLIPIAMPIEYDVITSLTRGLTSGLFFSAFLIFPLMKPNSKVSFSFLGLIVSLSYVFNPNALLFAFPICLYLLFLNYKRPSFYILTLICSIPPILLKYWSEQFYVQNDEYIVHSMWTLDFKFERFINAFTDLDEFFRYLTPFYWKGNWMILGLILILSVFIFKKNWKTGLSLILGLLFILIILGVNKVSDGIGVIFLSPTRMFLGLPMILGLAFMWMNISLKSPKIWNVFIVFSALLMFSFKSYYYPSVISKHTKTTNYGPVAIKKIAELEKECIDLGNLVDEFDADLLVFVHGNEYNVPTLEFINYGCFPFQNQNQPTLMNIYERRTWVYLDEINKVRQNVLLFNLMPNKLAEINDQIEYRIVHTNPNIVLVTNNCRSLFQLSELLEFDLKRTIY